MVRKYIRKTDRQSWDEDSMKEACSAIKNGMGVRKASKTFHVPQTTLHRRIKDRNKRVKGSSKALGYFQTTFSDAIEADLVNYIIKMETMMFGLTTYDVRSLAYQVAERNKISNPFNKETETAGKDWLYNFMQRHPELALRQPEATSAGRARSFNQENVKNFFDLLEPLIDKHLFLPNNIYNVDETGMTTVQSKPSKIIAKRGRRQVEICMSATGSFIPPLFIFPRVRMKPELMDGAPPGAISACHKSGWMQLSIFTMWFEHFIRMSGASKDNPVLLILDGHSTHTKNIEVIDLALENGVELCLPPHCSHKMQPLDVSFMKPLSTFYDQELEKWLRNNPGRVVTTFQMAEIFGKAYLRAATALTAANGFRRTGIFPTNRDVFEPHEFAAAEPTDLPESERIAPTNPTNERATMAPRLSNQANPAVSTATTKPPRSSAPKKSVPVTAPTAGLTRSVSLAPRSSVTAPTTGPTPSTSFVPKNSVPATTPTTGSTTLASSASRISVPVTAPTTAGPTPSMSSVPKNSVPATVPTTGPTTSASSAPRISVSATGSTAGPTTSVPSVLTTTEIQLQASSPSFIIQPSSIREYPRP